MEIAVPLVVGGLAGLSVATACGAEPRVPRMPPAELARQTLESMAEKMPRELAENDLLTKIARSWASLIPADHLGLAIEDNAARLAFLLLSSGICSVVLAVASLSPIGFVLGLVAPFGVGAARDTFDRRREQHDVEEAMPEAFTALSMSLASGHSLAQGMRFVGAHAQEPVHTEFLRVAAAIDCGISAHMVAAMPAGMCAVLALLSADFRRGLVTPAGAGAVVLGLALNVVALVVIRRIMRVEL